MQSQLYTSDEPVGLWRKLARAGWRAGRQMAEYALLLHYTAQNPETPAWARQAAYGALAYFILPTDAIPDWLAGMGYTDDLGVLAAAVATLSVHIDDQARAKTATRMRAIFGEKAESDRNLT